MEGKKNTTFTKNQLYWAILVIFILLLGGFFYWQLRSWDGMVKELYVDSQLRNIPEGIETKKQKDGTWEIHNVEHGYNLVVESKADSLFHEEGYIVIQDYVEPKEAYGGMVDCKAFFHSGYTAAYDIALAAEGECLRDDECSSHSVEQKEYNGITWFIIRKFGGYVGSGWPVYKMEQDGIEYSFYFQCSSQEYIDSVVSNFEFI